MLRLVDEKWVDEFPEALCADYSELRYELPAFQAARGQGRLETEVWLAEIPDHLIYFNRGKFLGPQL